MKLVFSVCAIMLAFATIWPTAQGHTIVSDVTKDWANMKNTMMAIADAMPEEKFDYRPTPAQRTFGEQIVHVAQANIGVIAVLGGRTTAPAMPENHPASKADALKGLAASYDYGTAVLKEQTDQSMLESVQGPNWIGTATRARIVWDTIGHAWDEYGVMTVYLRLNGIVPPASRGR